MFNLLFDPIPVERWMQKQKAPYCTQTIIVANILVFMAMCIANPGQTVFAPSTAVLTHWGASWAPLTLNDEPWRLLSSCFVHIGLIHISMNMAVLFLAGRVYEPLFGHSKYAIIYLFSGLGGSLASSIFSQDATCAGASGAICGLFGAYLAFFHMHKKELDPEIFKQTCLAIAVYMLFTTIYGISVHADHAGHFGGLLSGYLLASFLVPEPPEGFRIGLKSSIACLFLSFCMLALYYAESTVLANRSYKVLWMRAVKQYEAKDYQDALISWQKYLELHPDALGYNEVARNYLKLKEYAKALSFVNLAISLKSPEPLSFDLRLAANDPLGDWEQVKDDCNYLLKLRPDDPRLLKERARAALELGDLTALEQDLEKLKEHDDYYIDLASALHLLKGDLSSLGHDIEDLKKLNPNSPRPYELAADLCSYQNDLPGVSKQVAEYLRLGGDKKVAAMKTALCYMRQGQAEKASQILAPLSKADKHLSQLAATVDWARGDFRQASQDAEKAFCSATSLHSKMYSAYLNYLALKKCQDKECDSILSKGRALCREGTWIQIVADYLLAKLKQDEFLKAAGTEGEQFEARAYIGLLLAASGKTRDADPYFQYVLKSSLKDYGEYDLVKAEQRRLHKEQKENIPSN